MIDEKVLSDALHEIADHDDTGVPPVGLLRRGRRARLGRAVRTATVAAAASVLVAGVVAVAGPGSGVSGPVPLALAAQTTAETTFHFRLDTELMLPGKLVETVPWEGQYDPVHDRGDKRTVEPYGHQLEERQIGSDCFFHNPQGEWYRMQRCGSFTDLPETANLGEAADPGDLLAQLESAGKVSYTGRTGKGGNAVDTYRFTYTYTAPADQWIATKTGTVDIDVTSRRIIRVSYQVDFSGDPHPVSIRVDLRLDHFGMRVDVSPPANPLPVPVPTATSRS